MENDMDGNELPNPLLKAGDVARVLNISKAFAYHLMNSGKLPTVRIEGARRVRLVDLQRYIEENTYHSHFEEI